MKIVFTTQGNLSAKNNKSDYYLLTAIGFEDDVWIEGLIDDFKKIPTITPDMKIEGKFKEDTFGYIKEFIPHFFKYIYVDKKAIKDKSIFEDEEALKKQIFQALIESTLPLIPYYNGTLSLECIEHKDNNDDDDDYDTYALEDFIHMYLSNNRAYVADVGEYGGYNKELEESVEKYLNLTSNDILSYHQGTSQSMEVQDLLREPIIINQSSFNKEGRLKDIAEEIVQDWTKM